MEQDAQLLQRDRAAGCLIVFAKSGRLELGEYRLKIGNFAPMGAGWPKISGTEGVSLHQPFFFSEN